MKWLAFIFALYILALSAMPCCDKDCCADETAQSSQQPHKPEPPCSPFFMCNTCHGFIVPEAGLTVLKPVVRQAFTESFVLIDELAGFSTAAWQPPKFA